ncbi:MAG: hypothetical protein ACOCV1_05745 [Bacillota bacterium]
MRILSENAITIDSDQVRVTFFDEKPILIESRGHIYEVEYVDTILTPKCPQNALELHLGHISEFNLDNKGSFYEQVLNYVVENIRNDNFFDSKQISYLNNVVKVNLVAKI